MKPTRLLFVRLFGLALIAASVASWAWFAAGRWRASVPWPEAAMTPDRAWTEPFRTAHAAASQWPVQPEAVEQLARLYLANGFTAEASALLPSIIARHPDGVEWVHRRAVLAAGAGRLAEAVELWQSIRGTIPRHPPVGVKWADALAKLNRGAEAETIYREVLVQDPGNPYAWYGMVLLDVKAQRWAEAREKLRTAIAAAPEFYGHQMLLETVAHHLGDAAAATAADRELKRLGRYREMPDSWIEPAVADCYDPYFLRVDADRIRTDGKDVAGALERIQRAISLDPRDPMNYQLLATIQGVKGDEAAAAQAYERALELDPRAVTLYTRYANLLSRQGDEAALHGLLARAVAHCPSEADLVLRFADSCARTSRWRDALQGYQAAATLWPERPDLALKAAGAAFLLRDEATGLALLQENLARFPTHPETLGYLVMASVHHGDAVAARALLRRLVAVASQETSTQRIEEAVQARFGP